MLKSLGLVTEYYGNMGQMACNNNIVLTCIHHWSRSRQGWTLELIYQRLAFRDSPLSGILSARPTSIEKIDWLIDWLIAWLIDRSIDWLIDWLIALLIDWLIDWLNDCLLDWLIAWLIAWLIDWLIESIPPPATWRRLAFPTPWL